MLSPGYRRAMALLDLVTLPVRLAVAATNSTLALIPALHESVDTLNRAVEPLSDLGNRIPGDRRRPALEA
jgi:hypothetical protein